MMLLDIHNLHASIDDKPILKGVNLTMEPGKVHAIMGPNGSGKSTLANVIAGNEAYEVTDGSIMLGTEDLLAMPVEVRAQQGVFMAFQYPVEIPGVVLTAFLRQVINDARATRGQPPFEPIELVRRVREIAQTLGIDPGILARGLNAGLSGGEKKRSEVLQMALMEPKLALLDETDSGLDVDALRTVAKVVQTLRSPERSFLVVTHYRRLLDLLAPDVVHVMMDGVIVKTGDFSLVEQIDAQGYDHVRPAVA